MTPFNLGSRHGRHLDVNLDRDLPLYTFFEPDESTVGLVMYGRTLGMAPTVTEKCMD